MTLTDRSDPPIGVGVDPAGVGAFPHAPTPEPEDSDPMMSIVVLSSHVDTLHALPEGVWGSGSRQELAARVALWDDIAKKTRDMRDIDAQALGDLMEDPQEPFPSIGLVTRERPMKTEWKRDDCLERMRTRIGEDLALNKGTGELDQNVLRVAQFAIAMFLKVVSPPNPTVGGCKSLDINVGDYYSRTIDDKKWKITIKAER